MNYERKFSLPQNILEKEPGYETVSHDIVLTKQSFHQKHFDKNKLQNYGNINPYINETL